MNIKHYILLALLAPMAVRAEFTAQKDDIAIKVVVCTAQESVIKTPSVQLAGKQFNAKKFTPVWLELTNSSDRAIEISKHSIGADLINKDVVLRSFMYRTILRPLLTWIGVKFLVIYVINPGFWARSRLDWQQSELQQNLKNCNLFKMIEIGLKGKMCNKVGQIIAPDMTPEKFDEWVKQTPEWKEFETNPEENIQGMRDDLDRVTVELKNLPTTYATSIKWLDRTLWLNFLAIVPHYLFLSNCNKELTAEFEKQLLSAPISIAPGQTVKKLLIFNTKDNVTRFAVSTRDPRTQFIKTQFDVVL